MEEAKDPLLPKDPNDEKNVSVRSVAVQAETRQPICRGPAQDVYPLCRAKRMEVETMSSNIPDTGG